jgi:hypothetical protein
MNKVFTILAVLLVSTVCLTDKEILQQTLNGAFEQNKLPAPKTIIDCLDDATAKKIVALIGTVLDKAAKGSPADIISLIDIVKKFIDEVPQPVKDCLDGNAELKALGLKYGIDDTTESSAIEKKIITYITLHYLTVHKWAGQLNDEWKAAKYYQNGYDAATYAHSMLAVSAKEDALPGITNKEILQQALNGAFE